MDTITSEEDLIVKGNLIIADSTQTSAFIVSYDSTEETLNFVFEESI